MHESYRYRLLWDESNLLKASLTRNDEAAFQQAQDYLLNLNTRYYFVTDGDEFSGFYYDTVQFIKLEEIPKYDRWYYYPKE